MKPWKIYLILVVVLNGVQGFVYGQDSPQYPVILSSRWFHPVSPQDTLSTIQMVDLYHPDRIDWMYCTNAKQLDQLKSRHVPYSLAINPQVPDSLEYTAKGRVVDLNGKKLVAPWMQNWKQKNANWGCVNAPEFKKVFFDQSRKLIDLGAYGLFMDDARLNEHTMDWGGCYCDYCMKGFTKYLLANGADTLKNDFNYRNFLHKQGIGTITARNLSIPLMKNFQSFQIESVLRFLKEWRVEMKQYAKRPLVFLTNNYAGQWSEIYKIFDIGVAELPENRLDRNYILSCTKEAEKLNKKQYFTLSSDDDSKQTKALFLAYSANSALIIPWDVYVHSKSKKAVTRYFGKSDIFREEYDIFRQNDSLLQNFNAIKKIDDFSLNINSAIKNDSISLYKYELTNSKVFIVKTGINLKTHKIKITNSIDNNRMSINVFYPNCSSIIVKRGFAYVVFQDDTLIFSIK